MVFGPDGLLYIAFGDGGKRDDVTRTAQNPFALLGKILRIDVNTQQEAASTASPLTTRSTTSTAPGLRFMPWACAIPGA